MIGCDLGAQGKLDRYAAWAAGVGVSDRNGRGRGLGKQGGVGVVFAGLNERTEPDEAGGYDKLNPERAVKQKREDQIDRNPLPSISESITG